PIRFWVTATRSFGFFLLFIRATATGEQPKRTGAKRPENRFAAGRSQRKTAQHDAAIGNQADEKTERYDSARAVEGPCHTPKSAERRQQKPQEKKQRGNARLGRDL